ncbi:hypothetical protein, partial [Mesomycoplasma ovipneumoniae]|uniref:hypothetical protein n=1 Tax=Mesomycoplasma ovipneumoniae TaxID=29562 RepID=UPI003080F77E
MSGGRSPVAAWQPFYGDGIISLTERGVGELPHETFHGAMALALNRLQRAVLLNKYGSEEAAAVEYQKQLNSGALAEQKGQPLLQRIFNFFRNLRELIAPTAEGTFRKIASGKVWSQNGGNSSGGRNSTGRLAPFYSKLAEVVNAKMNGRMFVQHFKA